MLDAHRSDACCCSAVLIGSGYLDGSFVGRATGDENETGEASVHERTVVDGRQRSPAIPLREGANCHEPQPSSSRCSRRKKPTITACQNANRFQHALAATAPSDPSTSGDVTATIASPTAMVASQRIANRAYAPGARRITAIHVGGHSAAIARLVIATARIAAGT